VFQVACSVPVPVSGNQQADREPFGRVAASIAVPHFCSVGPALIGAPWVTPPAFMGHVAPAACRVHWAVRSCSAIQCSSVERRAHATFPGRKTGIRGSSTRRVRLAAVDVNVRINIFAGKKTTMHDSGIRQAS
jgi:hypothetical protein